MCVKTWCFLKQPSDEDVPVINAAPHGSLSHDFDSICQTLKTRTHTLVEDVGVALIQTGGHISVITVTLF